MSQPIVNQITGLVQSFDARVQATAPDAWGNPSPCAEWTARDVVVHVSNNVLRLGALLRDEEPTATVGPDEDIVSAWNQARDQFLSTVATADLNKDVAGPMGPMPAAQMIGRFTSMDLLIHSWDLARATGGDEQLDENIVAAAYSGLKPMDEMIRRPGVFADKVTPPPGADLQTEFLSLVGRSV
jgi:uncharacterized protein (TIGR03086 family)